MRNSFFGLKPSAWPWRYQPLDSQQKQIRILSLAPHRQKLSPLAGDLLTVSLLDKPRYDALSYAWGDVESSLALTLNGSRLHIRRNLENALRHLRLPDEPRFLWIDALCINQTDIGERSHQVQLMGEIYSQATTVRAWI
ncbi:heterokaryon incompatibility protein-domain-containing protein, partial [Immersiella caudata]